MNSPFRGEINAQRDSVTCQRHRASEIIRWAPTGRECVGSLITRLSEHRVGALGTCFWKTWLTVRVPPGPSVELVPGAQARWKGRDAANAHPSRSKLWDAGPYCRQEQALLNFCVLSP